MKQIFKLKLIIDGITYNVYTPVYNNTLYIAMDINGDIYAYSSKPTYNVKNASFEIDTNIHSYDLIAHYDGDYRSSVVIMFEPNLYSYKM